MLSLLALLFACATTPHADSAEACPPGQVWFTPDGGEAIDLSATFAEGTEAEPVLIDVITEGGALRVCEGHYYASLWVQTPQPVYIIGAGAERTTLDAAGAGRVIHSGDLANVTLDSLTATRGYDDEGGGMMYLWSGSSLRLVDVVARDNEGEIIAGAIGFGPNTSLQAERTLFEGNRAPNGGALMNYGTPAEISLTDTWFRSNEADWGGAIYMAGGVLDLVNVLEVRGGGFADNQAGEGGGVYLRDRQDVRVSFEGVSGSGNQPEDLFVSDDERSYSFSDHDRITCDEEGCRTE